MFAIFCRLAFVFTIPCTELLICAYMNKCTHLRGGHRIFFPYLREKHTHQRRRSGGAGLCLDRTISFLFISGSRLLPKKMYRQGQDFNHEVSIMRGMMTNSNDDTHVFKGRLQKIINRRRHHRAFSEFLESGTDASKILLVGLNHSPSSSRHAEASIKLCHKLLSLQHIVISKNRCYHLYCIRTRKEGESSDTDASTSARSYVELEDSYQKGRWHGLDPFCQYLILMHVTNKNCSPVHNQSYS